MKNKIKLFGIITLVAVIGFSMVACNPEPENENNPLDGTWWEGQIAIPNPFTARISFIGNNWIMQLQNDDGKFYDFAKGTFTVNGSVVILSMTHSMDDFGGNWRIDEEDFTVTLSGNILTFEEWGPFIKI